MNTIIILLCGVALLVVAIHFHTMAQSCVKTKIDREWYERLFTGSRAPKDNLTELGLRYRKRSNHYAIGGFLMISVYLLLISAR